MTDKTDYDPWRAAAEPSPREPDWARRQIETLLQGMVDEQRRLRRGKLWFRTLVVIGLALIVLRDVDWGALPTVDIGADRHVALIELAGVIAADADANADDVNMALRDAFQDDATAAVVLRINSSGGSPVQSGRIVDEIRRLRALHPDTELYAVIEDIGASGAYYVASAADAVYVDRASLVGSIGVIMAGFGFADAMASLGIERRVVTAGDHKVLLDPFLPERPEVRRHIQTLLDDIHNDFIAAVKRGRGDRLADDASLFSGLVWTGNHAVTLGLADGLGDVDFVAREVVGVESLVNFNRESDWMERLGKRFGVWLRAALGATAWQWR